MYVRPSLIIDRYIYLRLRCFQRYSDSDPGQLHLHVKNEVVVPFRSVCFFFIIVTFNSMYSRSSTFLLQVHKITQPSNQGILSPCHRCHLWLRRIRVTFQCSGTTLRCTTTHECRLEECVGMKKAYKVAIELLSVLLGAKYVLQNPCTTKDMNFHTFPIASKSSWTWMTWMTFCEALLLRSISSVATAACFLTLGTVIFFWSRNIFSSTAKDISSTVRSCAYCFNNSPFSAVTQSSNLNYTTPVTVHETWSSCFDLPLSINRIGFDPCLDPSYHFI